MTRNSLFEFGFKYASVAISLVAGVFVGFTLMGYAANELTPLITEERGYEAIGGEYLFYGLVFATSTALVYTLVRAAFKIGYKIYSK